MDLGGFSSKKPSLPSDGLETGLDGLDTARGVTGHALQEEQPRLLVQDRVRGSACMAGDILLDVPSQHILYMLLLKSAFHDKLVAAINGTTSSQLSKEESEQMLGLPVEHLGDFGEVGKRSFLASNSHHLWRSHHKLLFLAGDHVGVLVPHNSKHSLEELVVKIIPIRSGPRIGRVSLTLILLISIAIIQVVNIHFLLPLLARLLSSHPGYPGPLLLSSSFSSFWSQRIRGQYRQCRHHPWTLRQRPPSSSPSSLVPPPPQVLRPLHHPPSLRQLPGQMQSSSSSSSSWSDQKWDRPQSSWWQLRTLSCRSESSNKSLVVLDHLLLLLLGQIKSGIVLSHPAGNSVHSLVEVNQAI